MNDMTQFRTRRKRRGIIFKILAIFLVMVAVLVALGMYSTGPGQDSPLDIATTATRTSDQLTASSWSGSSATRTPVAGLYATATEFMVSYTTDSLHIRSGPGVQFPVLAYLGQDSRIRTMNSSCVGDWIRLMSDGDQELWVNARYLDPYPCRWYITKP